MQYPVTTLTLQASFKLGIPGRERAIYTDAETILGSFAPLSKEDYIKRYSVESYVDNGAYVLHTQSILTVGQRLKTDGKTYNVIGFRKGRQRNTAQLLEVTDV